LTSGGGGGSGGLGKIQRTRLDVIGAGRAGAVAEAAIWVVSEAGDRASGELPEDAA
jgi:hypothetical protein